MKPNYKFKKQVKDFLIYNVYYCEKKKNTQSSKRCQKNNLKKMGYYQMRVLSQLGKRTKNVYNTGLYCWKNWYNIHKLQILLCHNFQIF